MVKINIDGKDFYVKKGDNLLELCLSLNFDIPYFCWHPELGSVGSCRLCAVKQYKSIEDKNGSLVMSCMTPVTEESYFSINEKEIKQFRKDIIECLMINHPHDCPVCEEGGSCHLQDMTVMTGHVFRRYRFNKRTHFNQNLGPFISHEMNRCITCYRCVRYYRDYADGNDLGVYGVHDNIYFGRFEDGILENEFSGNLIEICPTGVFTDKTHSEHYSRKWDIQFAPSICHQCSVGCNISIGERYGEICRIDNRYNGDLNHYFLCDLGRFGYGYLNSKDRLKYPVQRTKKTLTNLNIEQAIQKIVKIVNESKRIIGIGSSRASIESNFALRELVGADKFYMGITDVERQCLNLMLKVLSTSGIKISSLREIEFHDAVLILGEDITQTSARVALAVRQAIKNKMYEIAAKQGILKWQNAAVMSISQNVRNPLFVTNIDITNLDDIASWSYQAPVEDQARLGFAIANAIDKKAPSVEDLDESLKIKVNIIAKALSNAKKPLIISGINSGSTKIIQAASNIAKALKEKGLNVGITMIASAVNSVGLSMIGGKPLSQALDELESEIADSVIILENNLYRNAYANKIDLALNKAKSIIVIDHHHTSIMDKAHIILSAASFAESNGTVVNNEGRAQRFFQVFDPKYYNNNHIVLDSWRWLYLLNKAINNQNNNVIKLDDVIDKIVTDLPQLKEIKYALPNADFRVFGQKLARAPHRYSGRTAIISNINVHEPRQPQDMNTMFSFSMEGNNQPLAPRSEIPFVWAPGWNSQSAWNKFQNEIGGHLRYKDPGICLIKTSKHNLEYFKSIPLAFKAKKNTWFVAPYYHIFGSDELSQYSPLFQTVLKQPYIKLNFEDALALGFHEGSCISFNYHDNILTLPLVLSKKLKKGLIGIPIGISNITLALSGTYINNLKKVKI